MFDRLELEDFQAHKRLDVLLGPLTTLVGPSDAGKSAVLRALRFLCLNDLRGDHFVRHGRNACAVRLWQGPVCVERSRKKSSNFYRLGDQEYSAFGALVPEPVADFLKLSPVNFQRQLDPPFWLTLPPPEVARQLNEVVDLDVIDRVSERLASGLRQAQSRQESLQVRLEQARAEEQSLAWAAGLDASLQRAEALETELTSLHNKSDSLRETLDLLRQAKRRRRDARKPDPAALAALHTQLQQLRSRRNSLADVLVGSRPPAAPATDPAPLIDMRRRLQQLRQRRRSLSRLLDDVKAQEERLCHARNTLSRHSALVESLTAGSCPLCGRTPPG